MSTTATNAESVYKGASFVFDSYAYVRRLRDAGMDEQQAAIQAETFMALAEDRLATKQDVAELKRDIAESNVRIATVEASLKRDIEATKAELKRDIAAIDAKVETTKAELRKDIETAKVETIKWVVVTGMAILGGVAAINRMFPPLPAYYHPPLQEMRQTVPPPVFPVPPAAPTPSQPAR
ncbi:MAG: hypothetical protein HQL88_05320 [Magnetococcales bacterium]|nr:hypothetical protein [Magnetococcales bacterium]